MTLHRVPFVVNRRNLNSGQDDWELPSSSDSPLPLVQTLISSLATPEPTMLCADIFIMYWFPHFNPEIVKALFSGSSSVMNQLSPAVWYDMVYPCSGAPHRRGHPSLRECCRRKRTARWFAVRSVASWQSPGTGSHHCRTDCSPCMYNFRRGCLRRLQRLTRKWKNEWQIYKR